MAVLVNEKDFGVVEAFNLVAAPSKLVSDPDYTVLPLGTTLTWGSVVHAMERVYENGQVGVTFVSDPNTVVVYATPVYSPHEIAEQKKAHAGHRRDEVKKQTEDARAPHDKGRMKNLAHRHSHLANNHLKK